MVTAFLITVVFWVLVVFIKVVGNIGNPKIDRFRLLDAIGIVETNNDYTTIMAIKVSGFQFAVKCLSKACVAICHLRKPCFHQTFAPPVGVCNLHILIVG
jgi:hypothetical protein